MERLTHVSLFSGIGGLDLAAEAAGFETVCQCEWADYPYSILERHWPDVPKFRDITTFTKEAFFEKTGLETVTILSGGFPCQPFSTAGKRRGFADERYLWPEMCRIITELRPRWVLGKMLLASSIWGSTKRFLTWQKRDTLFSPFVFPACGVGAWHERQRTFIVAVDVPTPLASDKSTGRDAANLDVFLSDNGIFRKRNKDGSIWSLSLSAAVFYLTPMAADGFLSDMKSQTLIRKKCAGSLAAQMGKAGTPDLGQNGAEPGLGGMAYGIPPEMDGRILWRAEPEGVPRMTEDTKDRALRLKTLGNAVCPPQAYPIFHYISLIETGACASICPYGGGDG